jgi:uncharacterized protein (DUF1330 family)
MPKGYVILTESIKDRAGMEEYGRASAPSMVKAKARVLSVDEGPQVLEGDWHGTRTVLLEFETVEAARAWYESAEYERAKPLRQAAADTNAVLLTGFTAPSRAS